MNIKQALNQLAEGQSLSRDEMRAVMTEVMTGAATPAQIGALLMALRIRGETIDEIVGAAEVMRGLVTRVQVPQEHLVDLVGTGGTVRICSTCRPRQALLSPLRVVEWPSMAIALYQAPAALPMCWRFWGCPLIFPRPTLPRA